MDQNILMRDKVSNFASLNRLLNTKNENLTQEVIVFQMSISHYKEAFVGLWGRFLSLFSRVKRILRFYEI